MRHGIKMVVDIVPNHTSNQHEWFKAALAAGPGSPERDRYIFRDGKGPNGDEPPTNWQPASAARRGRACPTANGTCTCSPRNSRIWNWKNPDVRADFIKTLRFWLDHGADGFRVDVAHGLAKDLDRDDLDDQDRRCTDDAAAGRLAPADRPPNEVHDIYREWRKVFNEYNPPRIRRRRGVGEGRIARYLYASPDELGQVFNFEFAKKDWIRDDMHLAIEEGCARRGTSGSTTTWVMSNHDVPRHATRFGCRRCRPANTTNCRTTGCCVTERPTARIASSAPSAPAQPS